MTEYRRLWIALAVLALFSPVGLYLPRLFEASGAWGEWGLEEIRQMLGYVPAGMEKTAEVWKAPLADYALPGQGGPPLARLSLSYILSAFVGMALCGGGGYLVARWLARRRGDA